jgi:16S rRNA (guanine527-N7)-methyltransferase
LFHVKQAPRPSDGVSRETRERLNEFVTLLLRWNRTINLISRKDEPDVWDRHVEDSIALKPFIPEGTERAIDLGSGGGFPGLVLSIVTGITFDLVESDQRKAAFLREAVRATAASAMVHSVRAEAAQIAPAPLVTARALAPLAKLLEWAAPFVQPGGVCLFPKGQSVTDELTSAAAQWQMRVDSLPSFGGSTILRISEIARVAN